MRADRMQINYKLIIISVIVILIAGTTIGWIWIQDMEKGEENYYSYTEFYYELNFTSNSKCHVLWPVTGMSVEDENISSENISRLVEDISILDGSGTFEIIECEKGWALNITFSGNIHLLAKKKIYDKDYEIGVEYFFNDLTMRNKSSNKEYFVFSSDNVTLNEFYCYLAGGGKKDVDIQYYVRLTDINLKRGWQSIYMGE